MMLAVVRIIGSGSGENDDHEATQEARAGEEQSRLGKGAIEQPYSRSCYPEDGSRHGCADYCGKGPLLTPSAHFGLLDYLPEKDGVN
ncbi:hypothetical protein [Streptomyces sp. NPDC059398]|uniref:hypothetical protein n=1 Tax=Streptomyces sp. NPDC059398 TaxID=3346820 RepID=UPI0036C22E53